MSKHSPSPALSRPRRPERPFRRRRGTKALVASTDRVLLVQETHANGDAFWTLPGGGVGPGESGQTALRRELREELCCRCVVGPRVDRFWYAHESLQDTISTYDVFRCALLTDATPAAGEGVRDHQWVRPTALPTTTLPQVRAVVHRATDVSDSLATARYS